MRGVEASERTWWGRGLRGSIAPWLTRKRSFWTLISEHVIAATERGERAGQLCLPSETRLAVGRCCFLEETSRRDVHRPTPGQEPR